MTADPTIAGAVTPDDHVLVIFGATGDLAHRKLLPGLWHLSQAGMMPDGYRIIGVSTDALSDDGFRALARKAVEEFGAVAPSDGDWEAFAPRLSYVGGAFEPGASEPLRLDEGERDATTGGRVGLHRRVPEQHHAAGDRSPVVD